MESKDLTIIIVTFKSEAKIFNCLKSISRDIPIIVVENSYNENYQKNIQNRKTQETKFSKNIKRTFFKIFKIIF